MDRIFRFHTNHDGVYGSDDAEVPIYHCPLRIAKQCLNDALTKREGPNPRVAVRKLEFIPRALRQADPFPVPRPKSALPHVISWSVV